MNALSSISGMIAGRMPQSDWHRIGNLPAGSEARFWARALRRIAAKFCWASLWIAVPIAVFTSSGWLGLVVHGLALTGALAPLAKLGTAKGNGSSEADPGEGIGPCAAEKTAVK